MKKTGFALMSEERFKEVTSRGGKNSRGGGFTGNPDRAKEVGSIGGSRSKRVPTSCVMYKGKKTLVYEIAKEQGVRYKTLLQRYRKAGLLIK